MSVFPLAVQVYTASISSLCANPVDENVRQSWIFPSNPQAGADSAGGAAAKPKAKKAKDPAKGLLRLPTPTTLRKEGKAGEEAIANTDPKAVRKFGKEKVKLVSFHVD